jgi:hypothetical protein
VYEHSCNFLLEYLSDETGPVGLKICKIFCSYVIDNLRVKRNYSALKVEINSLWRKYQTTLLIEII